MPMAYTSEVPANPETTDKDLALFQERVQRSENQDSERKKRAPVNWDIYGGNPWPKDARRTIEEDDETPATNVNLVAPTVDAVAGDQRVNRREVKFKPQDLSQHDDVLAGWWRSLVRHFFGRSGHDVESHAVMEQLIGGMGWMHAFIDYEPNGSPTIKVEWPPDFQMDHDGDSLESNLVDARYYLRKTKHDARDAQARWQNKKDIIGLSMSPHSPTSTPAHEVNLAGKHGDGSSKTSMTNQVEVWEYGFYREKQFIAWEDEAGLHNLPRAEFNRLYPAETQVRYRDTLDGAEATVLLSEFADLTKGAKTERYLELEQIPPKRPISHWPFPKKVFYSSRVLRGAGGPLHEGGSDAWLERPKETKLSLFPYVAITGYWQVVPKDSRVERRGLVDRISETQLLLAKIWTQTIMIMARMAKGGGFVNSGILVDPQGFNSKQGVPGMWHQTRQAVGQGDIVPNQAPTFPPGHGEMITRLMDAIQLQSSVSEYFKGTEDRERSNILVQNMQARTGATLSGLTDPVESARVMMGRVIMELIQNFIPPSTIMRILGEDAEVEGVTYEIQPDPETGEEVRVPIASAADMLKERSTGLFDAVIDTGEASANEKDSILNILGQLMPTIQSFPPALQDLLYKSLVRALPAPKGESVAIAEEFGNQLEADRAMQQIEGVMAALQERTPEELQQILDETTALLEQMAPPEEEAPAEAPAEQAQEA